MTPLEFLHSKWSDFVMLFILLIGIAICVFNPANKDIGRDLYTAGMLGFGGGRVIHHYNNGNGNGTVSSEENPKKEQ
jgi:hypothetical protein